MQVLLVIEQKTDREAASDMKYGNEWEQTISCGSWVMNISVQTFSL